jgi:hypothetical protein
LGATWLQDVEKLLSTGQPHQLNEVFDFVWTQGVDQCRSQCFFDFLWCRSIEAMRQLVLVVGLDPRLDASPEMALKGIVAFVDGL